MKRLAAGMVLVVALCVGVPAQGQHYGGHGWHGGYNGGGYHGGGYHGGGYGGYHGGYWRGGVFIGGPWWWGAPYPYYPYPYYPYAYYPPYPPVVVDRGPQVYIERPQEPGAGYWYYCPSAKAYYPTVPECSEDWIKVPPVSR